MNDCTEYAQLIDAYSDGALSADDERKLLSHVSNCLPCSQRLSELESLSELLFSLNEAPPESLHDDIIGRTSNVRQEKRPFLSGGVFTIAAAAMLVVILASTFFNSGGFLNNNDDFAAAESKTMLDSVETTASAWYIPKHTTTVPFASDDTNLNESAADSSAPESGKVTNAQSMQQYPVPDLAKKYRSICVLPADCDINETGVSEWLVSDGYMYVELTIAEFDAKLSDISCGYTLYNTESECKYVDSSSNTAILIIADK